MPADFAHAGKLMCKPCNMPAAAIMDKDPCANKFYFSFQFGDMMNNAGTIVSKVDHYKVSFVDSVGHLQSNLNVAKFTAPATLPSCCAPDAYTVKLKGDINTTHLCMGASCTTSITSATLGNFRLAITPFSMPDVSLPSIYISDSLSDSSTGQVQTFTGKVEMKMTAGTINALAANPKAKAMFAKAFAQTIGFAEDEVVITKVSKRNVGATAWTEMVGFGSARRLASHSQVEVKVDYEAITTDTTKTLTAASFSPATLAENIKHESAAIGTPATVTDVTASASSTYAKKGTASFSSKMFFHSFAAIFAVGTHLLF